MAQIVRMKSATGDGVTMRKYEDVLLPDLGEINPEHSAQFVRDFQYKRGDIIQCGYPKSGAHWMGNMIWQLKSSQATDRPQDTFLELASPDTYTRQVEPRIMFTHLPPTRLYPVHMEDKAKMVLYLRNPKDIVVSYYHHLRYGTLFKNTQTWDEFFQSFINGEIFFGSYFTFLREWEQVLKEVSEGRRNVQVELFYYEDFRQNPKENLARLSTYLGFNRDEVYRDQVLKKTTLSALREHYASPELKHPFTLDDEGNSVIFRKGQIGDWTNYLTEAQSETIDVLLENTLQHGIIKFKYDM